MSRETVWGKCRRARAEQGKTEGRRGVMASSQNSRGGVRQGPEDGEATRLPRDLNLAESNLIYCRFLEPWHVGHLAAPTGSERPPRRAAVGGPVSRADSLPPGRPSFGHEKVLSRPFL